MMGGDTTEPRDTPPPLTYLLCLALVLVGLPVALVLMSAVRTGALRDSAILAGCSVCLGTALATTFAWLSARTASPLRRILTPTMALLLAMPPLSYPLSWAMLGQRPEGGLNQLVRFLTGSDVASINLAARPGILLGLTLKVAAVSYLVIVGPFGALDSSLTEAARVAGASRLRALLTIELPALAPALCTAALLGAIVALDAGPATLGLVVMAVVVVLVARHLAPPERPYVTRPAPRRTRIHLGAWGWLSGAGTVLFVLVSLALPLGQLVLGSLQPRPGSPDPFTLDNYATVLADPRIVSALGSTIVVGLVAGFLATALAGGIAATIPIAGRARMGAGARVGRESARMSGASRARALVEALARRILPGFAAGWFIAAIVAMGNVDVPALLPSPGSRTLSVVALELFRSGSTAAAAATLCLLLGLITAAMAGGGPLLWTRTRVRLAPPPLVARPQITETSEVARV